MRNISFNDRALVAANEILRIVADAKLEPDLPAGELQLRLWRLVRDDYDGIAREMADDFGVIEKQ